VHAPSSSGPAGSSVRGPRELFSEGLSVFLWRIVGEGFGGGATVVGLIIFYWTPF